LLIPFNHPGRERTIVNISESAIPATSRLKREETYLPIIQIITVVFVIKIFLRLTPMRFGGAGSTELKRCGDLISTNSSLPAWAGQALRSLALESPVSFYFQ